MKKRGWARGGANRERERAGRGEGGGVQLIPGRWEMCPIQTLAAAAHPDGKGRQVWELLKEEEQNML